jgi:hypothetical protein
MPNNPVAPICAQTNERKVFGKTGKKDIDYTVKA